MSEAKAAEVLLTVCTDTKIEEKILFVTDDTSKAVADVMWKAAKDYPNRAIVMMTDRVMHGDEPPRTVAAAMAEADVLFGVTKFSLFHTDARRNAVKNGARFANMADYTIEMMQKGGLQVDFIAQGALMDRVSDVIEGEKIHITTKLGTDITSRIKGRKAIRQYGRSLKPGDSSSPPDIETALGPLEGTTNGILVVDGSIPYPGLGVLSSPIRLTIHDGRIVNIEGKENADYLRKVLKKFDDDTVYLAGEIGMGFNNRSTLSNRMLEDEGVMGTLHFGFGSNISFGGSIESNNHLDMVFRSPSVWVDDRQIMDNGILLIK